MEVYSFANIILLVNGTEIKGHSDGDDVVTLDRRTDSAIDRMGADGRMVVALSTDKSGTVVFNLFHTSESNAFMSGLINAQENAPFVPVTVQMKDTDGGDLGIGTLGYILRPATMQRGVNVTPQTWTIVVENLTLLHAGVTPAS